MGVKIKRIMFTSRLYSYKIRPVLVVEIICHKRRSVIKRVSL